MTGSHAGTSTLEVRASAPGKLILMGEHSVVYGRPALVVALDRRVRARIEARDGDRMELGLPDLGHREETRWGDVAEYARTARRRWERFARRPDSAGFREVRGRDPAHVVKVALGEAAAHLGDEGPPGLALRVESDLPVGRGFGSSAAVAVAVVAAYLAFRGAEPSPADVEAVALESERRQHGLPSGVDGATAVHGGVIWAEGGGGEGRLRVRPLSAELSLLRDVRVYDTGEPAEETGEVVAAVRERRDAEPERFERILDAMGEAVEALRDALQVEPSDPEGLLEPVRRFQARLEELGVVPRPVREVVRRIEERGGAAKISGAGSLDRPGAGGAGPLLVYHPDPGRIAEWPELGTFTPYRAPLGGPGLRVEGGR